MKVEEHLVINIILIIEFPQYIEIITKKLYKLNLYYYNSYIYSIMLHYQLPLINQKIVRA